LEAPTLLDIEKSARGKVGGKAGPSNLKNNNISQGVDSARDSKKGIV
jgi:hypothetical protein